MNIPNILLMKLIGIQTLTKNIKKCRHKKERYVATPCQNKKNHIRNIIS